MFCLTPFRALRALFLCLSLFALAACGASATDDEPADVVQAFYKAAAAGDADKAMQYMDFEGLPPNELPQVQEKTRMLTREIQNIANANGGLKSVKLLESSMEQENQRVKLLISYGNGKEQTESLLLTNSSGKWKILQGSAVMRGQRLFQ